MPVYSIITRYLSRKFLWYLFLISLVVILVLVISGAFGVLQQFRSTYIEPKDFWSLVLLRIPYLFNEISTIVGFISAILFLRYLSASNELIVINSSGLSIWRIFAVPIFLSFIFGVFLIILINPIASYSSKKYEKLETKLTGGGRQSALFISDSGIFFREEYQGTHRIIQVKSINLAKKSVAELIILVVDSKNELIKRIDAPHAEIINNQLNIDMPVVSTSNESITLPKLYLETNLSIDSLIQKFTPPEMVSIWGLPEIINKLTSSGLPTVNYQLYFFKQLFKPVAMSAMTLLAFWFFNFDNRISRIKNGAFALVIGIFAYFFIEIISRILAYGGVNPVFATLLPILLIILISNFVILHFQES